MFVNVGFDNFVNISKIKLITKYKGNASVMVKLRDYGTVIDCTHGRRTRSAIFLGNYSVALSFLELEQIADRIAEANGDSKTKICKHCGRKFVTLSKHRRVYCSPECYRKQTLENNRQCDERARKKRREQQCKYYYNHRDARLEYSREYRRRRKEITNA